MPIFGKQVLIAAFSLVKTAISIFLFWIARRNFGCVTIHTLWFNPKRPPRPDFIDAAKPDVATPLYEYFVEELRKQA